MRPNSRLMKATLTGALGGLLFGFDTVGISGALDALVRLYHLMTKGQTLEALQRRLVPAELNQESEPVASA